MVGKRLGKKDEMKSVLLDAGSSSTGSSYRRPGVCRILSEKERILC
jgi:hypothetical protein